jgi:hypothetical protein
MNFAALALLLMYPIIDSMEAQRVPCRRGAQQL